MEVDLSRQSLTTGDGRVYRFEIDEFKKNCLLDGLDDIALTLQYAGEIHDYEQRRARQVPWLFHDLD